jgi:hypothetical protein
MHLRKAIYPYKVRLTVANMATVTIVRIIMQLFYTPPNYKFIRKEKPIFAYGTKFFLDIPGIKNASELEFV